jgi:hypothetical protein
VSMSSRAQMSRIAWTYSSSTAEFSSGI